MKDKTSIICVSCGKTIMSDEGLEPLRFGEDGHMQGIHRESCEKPLSGNQTKMYDPGRGKPKNPELKYTPKGMALCNFTIAVNRYYKVENEYKQEVSYFDVTVWGKLAQLCAEKLKKGRGVRIIGMLKQDRWIDKEEKNRSRKKT